MFFEFIFLPYNVPSWPQDFVQSQGWDEHEKVERSARDGVALTDAEVKVKVAKVSFAVVKLGLVVFKDGLDLKVIG